MDVAVVEGAFIEAHKEIQAESGQSGAGINGGSCPLTDLKGFDSILIPNVIRTVARKLGITPPTGDQIRNIYVSGNGEQKLSVTEIAQRFDQLYCQGG